MNTRRHTAILAARLLLAALAAAPAPALAAGPDGASDDPKLPRVLVIGDSISMNYHEAAKAALKGVANYHRNEGNAASTAFGVANIDLWLGDYRQPGLHWDVIQFNHGLHDLKQAYDKATDTFGDYAVPLADYQANLEKEIAILKQTGAKLIWCSTTPVPNDNKGPYARRKGAEREFNRAALEVMRRHPGILVNDLCQVVDDSPLFDNWRKGRDVHFYQAKEQAALGQAVAAAVRKALALPAAGPPDAAPAAAPQTSATVSIDTATPAQPYSPMIFGGFLEHFGRQIYGGVFDPASPLADADGFRKDVVAALKELKTPVVRWPGGCFVSGYHWELGVGKDRKPTDDMAWGVLEPNTFGTGEFVKLSRLAGWQPYICTNAGNGTVEEMRNWVEYCNGVTGDYARLRQANGSDAPLAVRLWSIGNENYGIWEIGHKRAEQWAAFVLESAKAMKAADPRIMLSAAANDAYAPHLLQLAGDYLDYISIHGYWLGLHQRNDVPDYLSCIILSEKPEERIAGFIRLLEAAGRRGKIKIAFDEWNLRGWHHPGFPRKTVQNYADPEVANLVKAREKNDLASQYTMADALFSASFLNACLRHCDDVGMANIAPLVNTRGPLFVHREGIVKRTHFHTLAMYANLLREHVAPAQVTADRLTRRNSSVAVVDAVATVDPTGKRWAIALVNRHPSEHVACTVKLGDTLLEGTFGATCLAGDSPDAFNDTEHPDRVEPQQGELAFRQGATDLPPHSLTILRCDSPAAPVPPTR